MELANEKFALDEDVLHSTCPPGSTPKDIHRSFKIKRQHREQRKKLTSPAHRGYTNVRQPCVCFWWQEFSFLDSSDVSSIDNYLTAAGTLGPVSEATGEAYGSNCAIIPDSGCKEKGDKGRSGNVRTWRSPTMVARVDGNQEYPIQLCTYSTTVRWK